MSVEYGSNITPLFGDREPPEPPARVRPRVKKRRLLAIFLPLAILAVVSTLFGMMMAVASDLPDLENRKEYQDARNSVLVDSQGHTVYMFEKDESDESYCNGSCAKVWPPVTTKGQPQAGSGVSASKLTTLKRDDGSTQVVFDGHPLYTYVKDEDTEDAYGNGLDQFGAEWYGLHPNGQKSEASSES